jgi:protease-4
MKFAGRVWRLLVGIKDGLVLAFMLLFFFALYAVLTARPSPAQVREGALVLALDGVVVEERTPIDPFQALLSGSAPIGEYQARDLVRALDTAARDERITAVVLDLDSFLGGGQVHLQDIGEAIDRVRAADKPVLSFATAYADDALLLASHASEIWVDPLGGAAIAGPGGGNLYFGELLKNLDVNARVYRVGEYKSAVEPYLRNTMSEEARENYSALYGALWGEWQAHVKKARPKANIALATTRGSSTSSAAATNSKRAWWNWSARTTGRASATPILRPISTPGSKTPNLRHRAAPSVSSPLPARSSMATPGRARRAARASPTCSTKL